MTPPSHRQSSNNNSRSSLTAVQPTNSYCYSPCSQEYQVNPTHACASHAQTLSDHPTTVVTPELHDAFTTFTNDTSLFCLPVTITTESLTPQTAVPFSSQENGDDAAFTASLAQLNPLLEPKTPIYLLLRRSPSGPAASSLLALTYVPSGAPVRSKTLFASTRATLVRELGSEKFEGTVFATEVEEIVSAAAWRERDAEKRKDVGGGGDAGGGAGGVAREDLMGDKERELEAVRRAVEEARGATPSRDIGMGGSFRRGGNNGGGGLAASGSSGGGGMRIQMPMDDDAREALGGLQQGGLVQLVSRASSAWLFILC